jgi:hypothetical protein
MAQHVTARASTRAPAEMLLFDAACWLRIEGRE